jgi:hypothetical protein
MAKKSSPGNPRKHRPPDGVVLNALAFSTLLSSQETDAHHPGHDPQPLRGNP